MCILSQNVWYVIADKCSVLVQVVPLDSWQFVYTNYEKVWSDYWKGSAIHTWSNSHAMRKEVA